MTAASLREIRSRGKLRVVCLTSRDAISELAPEWNALSARIHDAHPSTSYAWVAAWKAYLDAGRGPLRSSLHVYAIRTEPGELLAVVPIVCNEVRVLGVTLARWLCVGIASLYSEPSRLLVAAEDEGAVIQVLSEQVSGPRNDVVFWSGLRNGGPAMIGLMTGAGEREQSCFSTLVVQLPKSWPTFEAGLSRKMRKTLRTNYRSLAHGNHDFSFRAIDSSPALHTALEAFFELHLRLTRQHRANVGIRRFVSRRATSFIRTLIANLARQGVVRVFQLEIEGQIVAMRLGFVYRERIFLYLFADDPAWRRQGALTITMAEIFKYAIANGHRIVYLASCRPLSNLRWRPQETRFGFVAVWQPTLRARMVRALRAPRRTIVRYCHLLGTLFPMIRRQVVEPPSPELVDPHSPTSRVHAGQAVEARPEQDLDEGATTARSPARSISSRSQASVTT